MSRAVNLMQWKTLKNALKLPKNAINMHLKYKNMQKNAIKYKLIVYYILVKNALIMVFNLIFTFILISVY